MTKQFDELTYVPGSQYLIPKLKAPDPGTAAELKVAKLKEADGLERFDQLIRDANGRRIGDADVVTRLEAIETKTNINGETRNDLLRQLRVLVNWAKDNEKKPIVAVPKGTVFSDDVKEVFQRLGLSEADNVLPF